VSALRKDAKKRRRVFLPWRPMLFALGAIKPGRSTARISPSLPFREERAGERRFSKKCRKLPLSPALSPLVPRRERENSISAADRRFYSHPFGFNPSASILGRSGFN